MWVHTDVSVHLLVCLSLFAHQPGPLEHPDLSVRPLFPALRWYQPGPLEHPDLRVRPLLPACAMVTVSTVWD